MDLLELSWPFATCYAVMKLPPGFLLCVPLKFISEEPLRLAQESGKMDVLAQFRPRQFCIRRMAHGRQPLACPMLPPSFWTWGRRQLQLCDLQSFKGASFRNPSARPPVGQPWAYQRSGQVTRPPGWKGSHQSGPRATVGSRSGPSRRPPCQVPRIRPTPLLGLKATQCMLATWCGTGFCQAKKGMVGGAVRRDRRLLCLDQRPGLQEVRHYFQKTSRPAKNLPVQTWGEQYGMSTSGPRWLARSQFPLPFMTMRSEARGR